MHLPDEIIIATIKFLEGRDLKLARLVCKTWCSYASRFLFDQIYVAPNRVDLEVFNAITQHPTLSKHVRRLIYDGSEFMSELTKESYVGGLWMQTASMAKSGLDDPDPEIRDWAHDCENQNQDPVSLEATLAKWTDQSFINRGYHVYQEHSLYQQSVIQSGDFIESLVEGLSRLLHLKSVALEGGWPIASLDKPDHGTPLAREWNRFYCIPHRWCSESVGFLPDGMREYWIINTALGRARRHIDKMAIGRYYTQGISPEVFARNDPTQPNYLGLDIVALSEIKRLALRLAGYREESAPEYCDIEGLPKLLGSMHSLQQLKLALSYSPKTYVSLYDYEQVFPRTMTWKNLEKLVLENFASNGADLLRLLLIQMPHLKYAFIGSTQLLKGCWESVIECLKRFNGFLSFGFADCHYECQLYHHGEEIFECDIEQLGSYVMHGGRHPCLPNDAPASASEDYMLEIDASLRDRLVEMKSRRTLSAI